MARQRKVTQKPTQETVEEIVEETVEEAVEETSQEPLVMTAAGLQRMGAQRKTT